MSDLQQFRLMQFASGLGEAWSEEGLVELAGPDGDANALGTWLVGGYLERCAWLSAGADLGFYPYPEARQLLDGMLRQLREQAPSLSTDDRDRLRVNERAEHLIAGDTDAALAIAVFSDFEPRLLESLFPAFQTAHLLALGAERDLDLGRFQRRLLSNDDLGWQQYARPLNPEWLYSFSGKTPFSTFKTTALDGLLAALRHIEALAVWAESARGPERTDFIAVGGGQPPPSSRRLAADTLVGTVGRVLRWRLDLSLDLVQRRLQGLIDSTESSLPATLEAADLSVEDVWPEGFHAHATGLLDAWDEISGQGTGLIFRDPTLDGGSSQPVVPQPEQELVDMT